MKDLFKFKEIQIGESFFKDGNNWLKRSTRTAVSTCGGLYEMVFYFGKDELVENEVQS
jgi:hypothetical protein